MPLPSGSGSYSNDGIDSTYRVLKAANEISAKVTAHNKPASSRPSSQHQPQSTCSDYVQSNPTRRRRLFGGMRSFSVFGSSRADDKAAQKTLIESRAISQKFSVPFSMPPGMSPTEQFITSLTFPLPMDLRGSVKKLDNGKIQSFLRITLDAPMEASSGKVCILRSRGRRQQIHTEDASNMGSETLEPKSDTTRSTPEDSALIKKSPSGDTFWLELNIDAIGDRNTQGDYHGATVASTGEGAPGHGTVKIGHLQEGEEVHQYAAGTRPFGQPLVLQAESSATADLRNIRQ
ncbi:hypothetical protein AAG570_005286 [Ranatra chinensis]|uniref:Uncharacterized protein n=1 Tax=Ranatra chinensis TaxID=642074 RepID=A0ABD0Y035_9HEMI